jgi:hypothetical protein
MGLFGTSASLHITGAFLEPGPNSVLDGVLAHAVVSAARKRRSHLAHREPTHCMPIPTRDPADGYR